VVAEAIAGLVSSIPTTCRTFVASDHVTSSFTIYQGAARPLATVTLSTRIKSDHGETVFGASETLPAGRFAASRRGVESSFILPLDCLAPGAYLLTFEAMAGAGSVERYVQFSVGDPTIERLEPSTAQRERHRVMPLETPMRFGAFGTGLEGDTPPLNGYTFVNKVYVRQPLQTQWVTASGGKPRLHGRSAAPRDARRCHA
jgi:hypothetical protein